MYNEEQPDSSPSSCSKVASSCLKIVPIFKRWTLIFLLIILGVISALLVGLTISGHLIEIQSLECGSVEEDAAVLRSQSNEVYGLMVPCFVLSLIGLLGVLRNNTRILKLFAAMVLTLSIVAFVLLIKGLDRETKMKQHFKERYLDLMPLTVTIDTQQDCNYVHNIYRWQTEYKCCGLVDGYKDWAPPIPDSCLCHQGTNSSSVCVEVPNSTTLSSEYKLVYEKIVVFVIFSLYIIAVITICSVFLGEYCFEKLKHIGDEKMIPVIYIKKLKTTTMTTTMAMSDEYETEEKKADDGGLQETTTVSDEYEVTKEPAEEGDNKLEGGVKDVVAEEGTNEEVKTEEELEMNITLRFIPESELRRLQEELQPPPALGHTRCLCLLHSKSRPFYVIQLDEISPLLPSGAVLIDAAKRSSMFWVKGPHVIPLPNQLPGVDYEVDSQTSSVY